MDFFLVLCVKQLLRNVHRERATNGRTLVDIFAYLWKSKKFWMVPIVVVVLFSGIVLFLAQGSADVARSSIQFFKMEMRTTVPRRLPTPPNS